MFVSYYIQHSGYGFMCIKDGVGLSVINAYIKRLFYHPVHIVFMRAFTDKKGFNIIMYTDGKYRYEYVDCHMRDVEDANYLFIHLQDKYGYTNIIGFI